MRSLLMSVFVVCLACAASTCLGASRSKAIPDPVIVRDPSKLVVSDVASKKLIRVAQELVFHTSVRDVPAVIDAWQQTGFDGGVFSLYWKYPDSWKPGDSIDIYANNREWLRNNMVFRWWDVEKRSYQDFLPDINALKSVKSWGRFTDNFIWSATCVADGRRPPDWFSDKDWEVVLHNTRLLARITKEVGFKGIFLDAEQYGGDPGPWRFPWNYKDYADGNYKASGESKLRSFEECARKVRDRGIQYARALTEVYPDIVLFVIPDLYDTTFRRMLDLQQGMEQVDYGLWPAFVDGLMIGLDKRATVVAGAESTYLYSQYKDFLYFRDSSRKVSLTLSAVPEMAEPRIQYAVGIWTDAGYSPTARFSSTDVSVNHRSPERHKRAVHNALAASDKYAWTWGEWCGDGRGNWLTVSPTPLILEYWKANEDGHKPMPLDWEVEPDYDTTDYTQTNADAAAASQKYFSSLEEQGYSALVTLPEFWKFRFDPEMLVRQSSWMSTKYDDRSWSLISSTGCWQFQGTRANGPGVYRIRFDVPAGVVTKDRKLFLAFGGLGSGEGHIYVNGGWVSTIQSLIDVTGSIKPGESNLVSIVFLNKKGPGGLMGPVKLLGK